MLDVDVAQQPDVLEAERAPPAQRVVCAPLDDALIGQPRAHVHTAPGSRARAEGRGDSTRAGGPRLAADLLWTPRFVDENRILATVRT